MSVYTPLPSKTSFRLIKLAAARFTSQPTFQLEVFPITDPPPFDALSYTWGTPFAACVPVPASHQHVDFEAASCTVTCNGRPFAVRRNLHDGLRRLQAAMPRRTPFLPRPRGSGNTQSIAYIWIDAICINQADLDERADQVQIMGRIYGQAARVVVWLGEEDGATARALAVMHRFAPLVSPVPTSSRDAEARRLGEERLSHVGAVDFNSPAAIRGKLGVESPELHEWMAFLAFMARPYFGRAWILQEVSLARGTVEMRIGPATFGFSVLVAMWYFLQWTGWAYQLDPDLFRQTVSRLENIAEDGRYSPLLGVISLDYSPLLPMVSMVAYLGMPKEGWPLPPLLRDQRIRNATDPRDKFYALLSMARTGTLVSSSPEEDPEAMAILRPNYEVPVETLYMRITRLILKSKGSLYHLMSKESPLRTQLGGLPSWVPDYTIVQVPGTMAGSAGGSGWCASWAERWEWDGREFADPVLGVKGYKVGRVARCGLSPIGKPEKPVLESIARLLQTLPIYYRQDAADPE
jgi:hypothetical protein